MTITVWVVSDKKGQSEKLLTVDMRITLVSLLSMLGEHSVRKSEPKTKCRKSFFEIKTQSEAFMPEVMILAVRLS